MPDYRYLIVGGGMTADAAVRGIRDHDPDGSIGLVGEEPDPPYSRPPLSKALWQGKDEASVWRGTEKFGVELSLGRRVVEVDLAGHLATDDQGGSYGYEKLLLATGGRPRRLPGDTGDDVVYFRRLPDYRRLRELADRSSSFVVLGGGFIGSELAAALNGAGCPVTLVFPEAGIGARLFPADLAASVNELYTGHGVDVRPGELVAGVERAGERLEVTLGGGGSLEADAVVAGLGIVSATELAEAAGLEVDDGIVVDEYGRADETGDVYAAGDVARFPATALGHSIRVEHEDQANSHGHAVGANMAGADAPYTHLPFFYSDLFELGYEAVGEVDSRRETVAEWVEPMRTGVLTYLDETRRPRGFLLVDVWGKVDVATGLIAAGEPLADGTLASLID
jgi:3-phenylpropionate/trans-cinnamate dioxygenase ferredoxin reductase component